MQKKSLITVIVFASLVCKLSAQNVGIGTSTPTRAKLELNGMVGNTTAIFGSAGNGIGLAANPPLLGFNGYYSQAAKYISAGYAVLQSLDPGTGILGIEGTAFGIKDAIVTGVRPALRFAANGRVSIGDNPGLGFSAQLNVGKDADKDASAWFSAPQWSAFNYTSAEHTYIRSGVSGTKLFLNTQPQNSKIVIGGGSSNVGINWSQPVYPFEIHQGSNLGIGLMRMGSVNHWLISVNQNYLKLFFRSTTLDNTSQLGVFDFTTGQYSASSDKRIKKEIEPLPSTLKKIMQLKAYRYEMKYNNPNHDQTFGLIAQDVKELFPALVHVTQNANTGYQDISDVHTIAYSGLAPIVIKALQEQSDMLNKLNERIAVLERK